MKRDLLPFTHGYYGHRAQRAIQEMTRQDRKEAEKRKRRKMTVELYKEINRGL